MDLIIRQARLRDRTDLVDIGIADGVIVALERTLPADGARVIDAGGRLVAPTFVEPHYHLDKCLMPGPATAHASLDDVLAVIAEEKRTLTVDVVAERATTMIELLVGYGITEIRSYADVDGSIGLVALDGVLEAARRCADIATVHVMALPQHGILQDPGTEERLREALRRGATVVGGHPQLELTPEDSLRHIDLVLALAREFDADVDMHVDETDDPCSMLLERYAAAVIRHGWQGRAVAAHCTSLVTQNDYYAEKVIRLVKRAGMTVCANPTQSLLARGRLDRQPVKRGLTRVRELLAAGVNVCAGQELFRSPFSPMLRIPDPLHLAQIMAYTIQVGTEDQIDRVLDMITVNAARALRLERYGIAVGARASLNVLDAFSPAEAVTEAADRLVVLKDGRIVAENARSRHLHRQGGPSPLPRVWPRPPSS